MIKWLELVILIGCGAVAGCGTEGAGDRAATSAPRALQLDSTFVPGDLRHLVPLAERWGIGDDVERNAQVDRADPAARAELSAAVEPAQARITAWLDSFGQGAMTDEAAAFMYMQLALEEMRAGTAR